MKVQFTVRRFHSVRINNIPDALPTYSPSSLKLVFPLPTLVKFDW